MGAKIKDVALGGKNYIGPVLHRVFNYPTQSWNLRFLQTSDFFAEAASGNPLLLKFFSL